MAASKEAELVMAVLIYAIRCLGDGDLPALRAMGFGPKEIDALQQLNFTDLNHLDAIRSNCVRVDLNRDAFRHIVDHIRQLGESEEMQQALIKADAPQEMMQTLYGWSSREYTRRRRSMTLEPAVGRPAEPEEAKAHALWNAWNELVKDDNCDLLTGEDYLALKESTDVDLRAIWHLTRRWAVYGNPEGRPPM